MRETSALFEISSYMAPIKRYGKCRLEIKNLTFKTSKK